MYLDTKEMEEKEVTWYLKKKEWVYWNYLVWDSGSSNVIHILNNMKIGRYLLKLPGTF